MFMFPVAVLSQYLFGITLFILSSFLILLILVQQGRGGGLAGALGGPGGQSAFGTKAGDIFTRVTIIVASVWIVLSAIAVYFFNEPSAGSALSNTTINTTSTSGAAEMNPGMGALPNSGAMAPLTPNVPGSTPATPSNTPAEVGSSNEAPLTFEPTTPAAEAKPAETTPAESTPAAPANTEPTAATEPAAATEPTATPAAETPAATEPAATETPAEQPASDSAPQTQP